MIYDFKLSKFHKNLNLNSLSKNNEELNFIGEFAFYQKYKNYFFCLRDPIGAKKLFYYKDKKKCKIIFSNSFLKLAKRHNCNNIFSVPKGTLAKIDKKGNLSVIKLIKKENFENFIIFKKKFIIRLTNYFKEVKKRHGNRCYVLLSGGLDSTIVAYYAKKVFSHVTAITGCFYHTKKKNTFNSDLQLAKKISKRLDINHIEMRFLYSDIKKKLKKILFTSQDWRDYNVHCATLNYFIASQLHKKEKKNIPIFSGDMMNEFCADYLPEKYDGKIYYNYKKIDKRYYQRFLINSLDSSSREVGVFDHYNMILFQPYSVMKDLYVKFPKRLFDKNNFKYLVNGNLIPKNLLKMVGKKKNRAQIVDNQGGILGYFLKENYDQKKLKKFFTKTFTFNNQWLDSFFKLGSFKTDNN